MPVFRQTTERRASARWVAVSFALALAACQPVASPSTQASSGATGNGTGAGSDPSASADLAALTIAAQHSMKGYTREHFPHWNQQGNGCDTREVVLKRDGKNVTVGTSCKITGGTWYSPYDGKTFTDPQKLDIDHMVPLADAWRSGADTWDDSKRSDFANDLTRPQLLAVSASANRAKGDQDPSQWRPTNRGYWCEYAQRWIAVKKYWKLTITDSEKSKLIEMLGTC